DAARLFGERVHAAVCSQRLDLVALGISPNQVYGAAADRAGRAQDRNPPRSCASYCHGNALSPPASTSRTTSVPVSRNPSALSSRPPWPGIRCPVSFTPARRLTFDTVRSLICATTAIT